MTIDDKMLLIDAGMDYDDALERFMGSEAMMEKLLVKFRQDPSYAQLLEGIEKRDVDTAFRGAHTLKGVAANFSFLLLANAASKITELLRAGNMDDAVVMMPKVTSAYEKVDKAILSIFGENQES